MSTQTMTVDRPKPAVNWGRLFVWLLMGLLLFVTLFPLYWVLRTALTDPTLVYSEPTSLIPPNATWFNFQRVLGMVDTETAVAAGGTGQTINFFLFLRNSIIVSSIITLGQVFFSATAAYSFARLRFPFRDQLFFLYISALMVPGIVTLIPNFILVRNLNWLDTFAGIVAPYFLMTPFAVFFLRQFFMGINREVEESARIDGAGPFTIFWRIILPVSQPPLVTLGIITFITSWNEYLWPFVVGRGEAVRVLTVALGIFRSQTPQGAPDWTGLMAGTMLAVIPTILLFLFLGRRVLDSIQFTGFK